MSYKFFPHTEDDIRAMLKTCGEKSLDDLYKDIPEDLVLKNRWSTVSLAAANFSPPTLLTRLKFHKAHSNTSLNIKA